MGWKFSQRGQVQPANQGLAPEAVSQISALAPLIQEQMHNALEVDGHSCTIYRRITNLQGTPCVCSSVRNKESEPFDEKGNATQEHLQEILTESGFGFREYGFSNDSNDTPQAYALEGSVKHVAGNNGNNPTLEGTSEDWSDVPLAEDTREDIYQETPFGAFYVKNCPICMGTGIVEGYQAVGQERIILDAQSMDQSISQGVFVDALENPWRIEVSGKGFASWYIVLPALYSDDIWVRVFDGNRRISGLSQIQVSSLDNVTTNKIPEYVFSEKAVPVIATGKMLKISVGPEFSQDSDDVFCFTHVEISARTKGSLWKVDFPDFDINYDARKTDQLADMNLVFSPRLGQLAPYDVVADHSTGTIWMIQSIRQKRDKMGNLFNLEAQARQIQTLESFKLLRHEALTASRKSASFNFSKPGNF